MCSNLSRKILDRAHSLVGTKFITKGRNPKIGLDCVGFVIECLIAAKIDVCSVFQPDKYDRKIPHRKLVDKFMELFTKVDRIRPGDLAILNTQIGRKMLPRHVVIYIGDEKMIHCTLKDGVIVADYLRPFVHSSYRVG